ncbi:hypothetical protein [Streptomyces globisporus]|uniref:hypothetical protein n=1 Tax=Streptomyces globisporus TaxID=1908 RepID=UPI00346130B7
MITRIEIDPNVRVRGNGTRAGFEDVSGPLAVNMMVEVFEPESELVGPARVTEIDTSKQLVFLSVEWASLEVRPGTEHGTSEEEAELAKIFAFPAVMPQRAAQTPVWLRRAPHSGFLEVDAHLHEIAGQNREELVVTAL